MYIYVYTVHIMKYRGFCMGFDCTFRTEQSVGIVVDGHISGVFIRQGCPVDRFMHDEEEQVSPV